MSAGDHMVMGGFLALLASWLLGTALGMVIALTTTPEAGLIVGTTAAVVTVLVGLVEFTIGAIGAGVRLGMRR